MVFPPNNYFRLKNGDHYQGYIDDEVARDGETITFFSSGPMAPDDPYIVRIADIDLATLAYWDDEKKKWTDFKID
jgi:hypothetical protein